MPSTLNKSLREVYPKRLDIIILIIASGILLVVGLYLPIFTVRKLWERNTFSILTGILNLWHERYYFLALIIFFFSVIFPFAKLASLFVIWLVKLRDEQRRRLLYFLEILGKWSMLDVFVAAVIIVSVKLGVLASARMEKGIYFFGASIIIAMLVSGMQAGLAHRSQ
jgi:paraquat-inducible protein A